MGQSLPIFPRSWVRDYKIFARHEKLVAGNAINVPSEVLLTISCGTLVWKHWCQDCLLILLSAIQGLFCPNEKESIYILLTNFFPGVECV